MYCWRAPKSVPILEPFLLSFAIFLQRKELKVSPSNRIITVPVCKEEYSVQVCLLRSLIFHSYFPYTPSSSPHLSQANAGIQTTKRKQYLTSLVTLMAQHLHAADRTPFAWTMASALAMVSLAEVAARTRIGVLNVGNIASPAIVSLPTQLWLTI